MWALLPQVVLFGAGLLVLQGELPRLLRDHRWLTDPPAPAPAWRMREFLLLVATGAAILGGGHVLLGRPDEGRVSPALLATSVGLQALVGVVAVALLRWRGATLPQLGLHRAAWRAAAGPAGRACLAVVPAVVLAAVLNLFLLAAAARLFGSPMPSMLQRSLQLFLSQDLGPAGRMVFVTYAVAGAAVVEEVVFRGLLYGALRHHLPWTSAAMASALIFAFLHGEAAAFLPLTVLGLLLAALRERSDGLALPILTHALNNGLALLATAVSAFLAG